MWDVILAAQDLSPWFLYSCVGLAVGMLIWDTVEVGRNDAANLVNAVFGARILRRETAVWVAGIGVVLGATLSSSVIDTARKGIFDPLQLTVFQAFAVYTAVYIVDTVLLYGYSAYGMPVSTTACLVFELLGASFAMGLTNGWEGGIEIVKWANAGQVVMGIVCSIAISGAAGFIIQRMVRGAIGDRCQHLSTLLLHGGWAGGGMVAALCYFMLVKGMKSVEAVQHFHHHLEDILHAIVGQYSTPMFVVALWAVFAILIHACLVAFREKAAYWLFPVLAIVGMVSMGFAFGQNDLANCAAPGLAAWNLFKYETVAKATRVDVDWRLLLVSGFLLLLGMTTKNAQRVTRAEVSTGSMSHNVTLWAPRWCIRLARALMRFRGRGPTLAPAPRTTPAGKKMHYDPLRACVILTVSASVIATASSLGLPVSTTYVAFAAVVATGAADRILQRGDGDLKLARTIWVVFSWFASGAIAAVAAGLVCLLIYSLGVAGTLIGVGINVLIRWRIRKRSDEHEKRARQEARDRAFPEQFAETEY